MKEKNIGDSESSTNQWSQLVSELSDRLTGKEALITYNFENFAIDMPRAAGPNGKNLGSATWTINGKIIIKAEAHKNS